MSALFWACGMLVAFTYAGYPLCIVLLARLRPRPLVRGDALPTVTAVMAVRDAPEISRRKLANLLALDYPPGRLDVVVACDGCSDDTAAACRTMDDPRVQVLEFADRRGKAACLVDAVAAARGEVLLMVDARQRVEPQSLRALVGALGDPTVGAAGGELRFEDPDTGFAASVDAYWRYERVIRQAESGSGSVVGVSGALYAVRRALFPRLPEGTVLDDVLVPMSVVRAGWRVVYEPGAVAWDRASRSPREERARKVRTLAGNLQLVQLAPWLLLPGVNPIWFRFTCHKLLRLVAPWALLLMLLASCVLAPSRPFHLACVAAAGLAAATVALAPMVPRLAAAWPVRLLVAFLHMNIYSAQATIAFARRRRLHLW